MFVSLLHLLTPLSCFIINILSQFFFIWILSFGLLKSELFGFIIGFLLVLMMGTQTDSSVQDVHAIVATKLIIYTSLSYCYFHFVNLAITARRIRLIRELYSFEDGLTMGEILRQYNARDMIENRIKRLIDSGQIVFRNGRYFIGKPVILLISEIIIIMKRSLLGKRSEFD